MCENPEWAEEDYTNLWNDYSEGGSGVGGGLDIKTRLVQCLGASESLLEETRWLGFFQTHQVSHKGTPPHSSPSNPELIWNISLEKSQQMAWRGPASILECTYLIFTVTGDSQGGEPDVQASLSCSRSLARSLYLFCKLNLKGLFLSNSSSQWLQSPPRPFQRPRFSGGKWTCQYRLGMGDR